MVLRNSVKSLQNVTNEVMTLLGKVPVSASAYSQARYKFKHSAFMALNQKAIVETMYADDDYQTFWGFRVLAIDGSKIVLPDTQEIRDEFGTMKWVKKGKEGESLTCHTPAAMASVLYDVLNRVALDAILAKSDAYEVDLAIGHLSHTCENDLIVEDRGYASYRMLAEFSQSNRHFVVRCGSNSFQIARQMLKGIGADSQVVTLKPCKSQAAFIKNNGLPRTLTVRFVRVLLSTGQYEVLVSSLLDEQAYPSKQFGDLYWFRWEIETFYGLIKTRLELENFTGIGVEAVKQDFYATIYLTGMESVLTDAAQAQLDTKQNNKHMQIVNRAVSFNAIKNQAFDLLYSKIPTQLLTEKLTALFLTNPVLVRKDRNPPRKKSSASRLLNFHKRQKKHCF
jgi:hypothetical protein